VSRLNKLLSRFYLKKVKMRSYLIISRKCRYSRDLLKWLIQSNVNRTNLRIIDIDTHSCKGIARKISKVPALVVEGTNETVTGLDDIKRSLDIANIIIPSKESLTPRSRIIQEKKIPVRNHYRGSSNETVQNNIPPAPSPSIRNDFPTANSGNMGLYSLNSLNSSTERSMCATANIGHVGNDVYTASGRRAEKSDMIENDLERLMEQRKNIGCGLKRIG
jgi:hypothetical protein